MKKLLAYPCLVLAAIAVAAAFGVLHDQVSYTIAPEYFTKFKFVQFHLVMSPLPDRAKVALVGCLAAWWMGIPIGGFVGLLGLRQRDAGAMIRVTLASYVVVVGVTVLTAAVGLAYGVYQTRHVHLSLYRDWYIPPDLEEPRRFLCAGYMHNASYLGGVLGIIAAVAYQRWRRRRTGRPGGEAALGRPPLPGV